MNKEDEKLKDPSRFLLPDLLDKPLGMTDEEGNMIFPEGSEIPQDHYIFFYPIEVWKEISK